MRGKTVNISIGILNLIFGILIFLYTFIIPQDITLLTVQENQVKSFVLIIIYIIMAVVVLLNIIEFFLNKQEIKIKRAYLFSFFILSFIFVKEPIISIFLIFSGLSIILNVRKENIVETNSIGVISIIVLLAVIVMITGVLTVSYSKIGTYIKDKENENELAYKQDYFRYVTELNIEEPYINVKKDGKFGYIKPNGEIAIDFKYDYASPFIKIILYDKTFDIALVCKDGSSYIILKNERKVMSYRSESSDENYDAKRKELENLYRNTFKQTGDIKTEINKITNNIAKIPVYKDDDTEGTYKYNFNIEYDLIVTKSNMGFKDKYELAKKDNPNIKIALECDAISYDENYAYIFSNGTIPFYDISKKEQGWFNSFGKKTTISGKAQILDFVDNTILLKNYNNKTIYFIDSSGKILSDVYKSIYVLQDRYIVKGENDKYKIIGKDYKKIIDSEYDIIDPYLANYGLYIVANTSDQIKFNQFSFADMSFSLINSKGEVIMNNIEQIYGNYYKISTDKSKNYSIRYTDFLNNLKTIEYHFVGDKFYSQY